MAVTAEEMTVEQKRALALASARARAAAESGNPIGQAESMRNSITESEPAQMFKDFVQGSSGMLRGALSLAGEDDFSKGIEGADASSGSGIVGSLVDPLALATGSGIAKVAPYTKVLGGGLWNGIKAAATNLGAGAATGGIVGGLTNTEDHGEGAGQGAVIGALMNQSLPPAARGVLKLVQAGKELINPEPALLAVRAAGDKVQDVINSLMANKAAVPGAKLNAGQASVGSGSAEFAALQGVTDAADPSLAAASRGASEGARKAAVRSIGGTPADLDSARGARQATSNMNYADAFQRFIVPDKELSAIYANPFVKSALADAQRLADAEGISQLGNPTQFLHYVKLSLDKQLSRSGDTALSATEKRLVNQVQDRLVSFLGSKNRVYENARAVHEAMSEPINRMELGQELEAALTSPLGRETPPRFAAAVRKAGTETDVNGATRLDNLTPQQRGVVNAILGDLGREDAWKRLAQTGESSLKERIAAPQAPPTGIFSPIVSAARSWFNRATGGLTEQGIKELAPLMQDPPKLAALMQQLTPQQRAAVSTWVEKNSLPIGASVVSATEQTR